MRKLFRYISVFLILIEVEPSSVASPLIRYRHQNHTEFQQCHPNKANSKTQTSIAEVLGFVADNSRCGGHFVEPPIVSRYPHPKGVKQEPAIITARGPAIFRADGVSVIQKDIVVSEPGRMIEADKAYIYRDGSTGHITKLVLVGHVKLRESGKLIVAERGSVTLYPKTAELVHTAYHIYSNKPYGKSMRTAFDAWGVADKAVRDENQVTTLSNATYTTCTPIRPSWIIRARRIVLDKVHHIGRAYHAVLTFKHLPLFFTPYYSFPLDHERKTGFLAPRVGYMSRSGGDFAFPFYWNIAPNYDLTLTPEYLTQRNFELSSLFRFMSERSLGAIFISFLPNDTAFQNFRQQSFNTYSNAALYNQDFFEPYLNQLEHFSNARGFLTMNDTTTLSPEWIAHINLNVVSDPYYFQDLGGLMGSSTLSNQLLNQIDLQYSHLNWDFTVLAQAYQTLHLITQTQNPALDQYKRLPDLSGNGYYPNIFPNVDFNLNTSLVNFDYDSDFTPDKPTGQRLHLRPGLSAPINFASGYITPQVWLDATGYNVDHAQPGQASSADRLLPIIDVDSGLYFDRDFFARGGEYIQTFEPRVFYLYVPYQNQNNLPNFDTVLLPFSFEQLFAFNRFTGDDRLSNASQISIGLISRILDGETASPILTGNLGFGYAMENPMVCLSSGCQIPSYHLTPIVGELDYSPGTVLSFSGSWAWDPNFHQTNNTNFKVNYKRDDRHIISVGYLFVKGNGASITPEVTTEPNNVYSNNTSQFTYAMTWPIYKEWSGVGYWDYNISRSRTDTYFAGLQYDTCCWALRFVTQRSYVSYTVNNNGHIKNNFDTSYFIQLQLKGLGDFGTANMNQLLSSAIPGFPS